MYRNRTPDFVWMMLFSMAALLVPPGTIAGRLVASEFRNAASFALCLLLTSVARCTVAMLVTHSLSLFKLLPCLEQHLFSCFVARHQARHCQHNCISPTTTASSANSLFAVCEIVLSCK